MRWDASTSTPWSIAWAFVPPLQLPWEDSHIWPIHALDKAREKGDWPKVQVEHEHAIRLVEAPYERLPLSLTPPMEESSVK